MNVTVLYGGPSAEREISLISGRSVIEGLKEAGHTVFASDISPDDLSALDHPADVVFPVLHGAFGESGELQEILENRGIPFVGSGSKASRIGIDKAATKKVWEEAGLPTPPYRVVTSLNDPIPDEPCVVKALDSGSSIDVFICKGTAEGSNSAAREAVASILKKHGRCLVEKFVQGPELTVGVLEEVPLAPILIIPKSGVFDFEAKYQRSDTEHKVETGLPEKVIFGVKTLVKRANEAIGARDLARVDVMLDAEKDYSPYLLEINTMPGFTPKSLLPEAARHAGIGFSQLVDRLVRRAAARG